MIFMEYNRPDLDVTDIGHTDQRTLFPTVWWPSIPCAPAYSTGLFFENAVVTFRWHNREIDRHTCPNVVSSHIRVSDYTCVAVAKTTMPSLEVGLEMRRSWFSLW